MSESFSEVLANADCLFNKREVQAAVMRMAADIRRDLADSTPLVLSVMTGGLIPTGMLLEHLDFLLEIDYIHATRYQEQTQGGILDWRVKPHKPLVGRHVLIIDDILDEGITLREIVHYCQEQGAASVRTAVLSIKNHGRPHAIDADYVGLELPSRYVFGCGMDYKGYFRNFYEIYAVQGM
ncbi:MAG: hypoxanthine-guanine phosphoribosyltransferase [Gammaproteobacteria bacterium]